MKNETARREIESLDYYLQNHTDDYSEESHTAMMMGIKALEQEPKILETIDFAINASNGDTNYFVGFRNGLRYSKSLIDGEEPQFENCTEQEPKTGHWIYKQYGGYPEQGNYHCSKCDNIDNRSPEYCSHCGVKMIELQESEGEA